MTNDSLALTDDSRARLDSVGRSLLRLHKSLLDVERRDYEALYGQVSAGQMLHLLLKDDWFAWLRVLSELVVQVDELAETKEPATEKSAEDLLQQVRTVLQQSDDTEGFSGKYHRALQHNPAAIILHAEVFKLLPKAVVSQQ